MSYGDRHGEGGTTLSSGLSSPSGLPPSLSRGLPPSLTSRLASRGGGGGEELLKQIIDRLGVHEDKIENSFTELESRLKDTALDTLQEENRQLLEERDVMKTQMYRALGHMLARVDDIRLVDRSVSDFRQEMKQCMEEMKQSVVKEIQSKTERDIRMAKYEIIDVIKSGDGHPVAMGDRGNVGHDTDVRQSHSQQTNNEKIDALIQDVQELKTSQMEIDKKLDTFVAEVKISREEQQSNASSTREDVVKTVKKSVKDVKIKFDSLKTQLQEMKDETDTHFKVIKEETAQNVVLFNEEAGKHVHVIKDRMNDLVDKSTKDIKRKVDSLRDVVSINNKSQLSSPAKDPVTSNTENEYDIPPSRQTHTDAGKQQQHQQDQQNVSGLDEKLDTLTGHVQDLRMETEENMAVLKDELATLMESSTTNTKAKLDRIMSEIVHEKAEQESRVTSLEDDLRRIVTMSQDDVKVLLNTLSADVRDIQSDTESYFSMIKEEMADSNVQVTADISEKMNTVLKEVKSIPKHQQDEEEENKKKAADTGDFEMAETVITFQEDMKEQMQILTGQIQDIKDTHFVWFGEEIAGVVQQAERTLGEKCDHIAGKIDQSWQELQATVGSHQREEVQGHHQGNQLSKEDVMAAIANSQDDIKLKLDSLQEELLHDINLETDKRVTSLQQGIPSAKPSGGGGDISGILDTFKIEIVSDIVAETRKQRSLTKDEMVKVVQTSTADVKGKMNVLRSEIVKDIKSDTAELSKSLTATTDRIEVKLQAIQDRERNVPTAIATQPSTAILGGESSPQINKASYQKSETEQTYGYGIGNTRASGYSSVDVRHQEYNPENSQALPKTTATGYSMDEKKSSGKRSTVPATAEKRSSAYDPKRSSVNDANDEKRSSGYGLRESRNSGYGSQSSRTSMYDTAVSSDAGSESGSIKYDMDDIFPVSPTTSLHRGDSEVSTLEVNLPRYDTKKDLSSISPLTTPTQTPATARLTAPTQLTSNTRYVKRDSAKQSKVAAKDMTRL